MKAFLWYLLAGITSFTFVLFVLGIPTVDASGDTYRPPQLLIAAGIGGAFLWLTKGWVLRDRWPR
ncbi:MAG: hypothetical protein ACLGHL_11245 [Actinomycetota bacterium]